MESTLGITQSRTAHSNHGNPTMILNSHHTEEEKWSKYRDKYKDWKSTIFTVDNHDVSQDLRGQNLSQAGSMPQRFADRWTNENQRNGLSDTNMKAAHDNHDKALKSNHQNGDMVCVDVSGSTRKVQMRRSSIDEGMSQGDPAVSRRPCSVSGDTLNQPRRQVPPKLNRRSMSDLGLSSNITLAVSSSRTLALLQHPAFRKRIARSMSLDPAEQDFEKEVCEKLSSKVEDGLNQLPLQPEETDVSKPSGSGPTQRLSCSTSDLGMLRDLQTKISSDTKEAEANSELPHDKSHKESSSESSTATRQKTLSDFKIPSFDEFRARTKRMPRCSSGVAEYTVPQIATIQEEEPTVEPPVEPTNPAGHESDDNKVIVKEGDNATKGQDNCTQISEDYTEMQRERALPPPNDVFVYDVRRSPDGEEMSRHQVPRRPGLSITDDMPIPKERKKNRKARPIRSTDLGIPRSQGDSFLSRSQSLEGGLDDSQMFKVPVPKLCDSNPQNSKSLRKLSVNEHREIARLRARRPKSVSECSDESLDSIPNALVSRHGSRSSIRNLKAKVQEKIRKFPLFRSHSELHLNRIGFEPGPKKPVEFSDCDSPADLSDGLEDVFLQPPREFRTKNQRPHHGSTRSLACSDSGCGSDTRTLMDTFTLGRTRDHTMWRSSSDISNLLTTDHQDPKKEQNQNGVALNDWQRQDSKDDVAADHEDNVKVTSERSRSTSHSLRPTGCYGDVIEKSRPRQRRVAGKPPSGRRKLSSEVDRGASIVSQDTRSSDPARQVQVGLCVDCRSVLPAHLSDDDEDDDETTPTDICTSHGSVETHTSSDTVSHGSTDAAVKYHSTDTGSHHLDNFQATLNQGTSSHGSEHSTLNHRSESSVQGTCSHGSVGHSSADPAPVVDPCPEPPTPRDPVCPACRQKRTQRKEAILELVDTERSFGNDLSIIHDQFYAPMRTMGLLSADHIQTIFINLTELIAVNAHFTQRLQANLDTAETLRDTTLQSVSPGRTFLDSSNLLLAYETYCIHHAAAPVLLDTLVDDKELLRVFLEVTQRERAVLRKMDLKAFLMVPVQRIMKYPLLLGRIHKATPPHHPDREHVIQAQRKIENILELINYKTKGSASVKLRRRMSSLRRSGEFDVAFENIETHRVAMETLGWDRSSLHFLCTGRLLCAAPTDHMWARRGRTIKFTSVYGLLVTQGKYPPYDATHKSERFPRPCPVTDAALVLVRERAGRYQPHRDPFPLRQCVVSVDPDYPEVFELQEALKDSVLIRGEHSMDTQQWLQHTKMLVRDLNQWRHRRHALANIMLQDL